MIKRILLLLLLLVVVLLGYTYYWFNTTTDIAKLPPLKSGDLIFQTSMTPQTTAILVATASPYIHVGIAHVKDGRRTVIHAGGTVAEIPLADFIERGAGQHVRILRYPGLTDAQREKIAAHAGRYLGRSYDRVFSLKNDDIYCSELVRLAYEAENLSLGALQKVGTLNVNNHAVRTLFDARWRKHPDCRDAGMDAQTCWRRVMDEDIVTPVSLARDPKLEIVYSNY